MIRSFLRASALTPFFFGVALAQDDTTLIDEVTVTDRILEVDDQPEAIDLIPAVEARALVHAIGELADGEAGGTGNDGTGVIGSGEGANERGENARTVVNPDIVTGSVVK